MGFEADAFLLAGDVGGVTAARAVLGFATGAATSAFTAEIVELSPVDRPALGGVIGSTAPVGGLALGALLTGAAVQFAANPRSLTFGALTVVMAAGTALACFLPDTDAAPPPSQALGHTLVPGLGHMPPLEDPERIAELITVSLPERALKHSA
ncbi:MAG: hypothetical protein QOF85_1069 [Solirubrobacterales bacterium]|nr:hypothetical protein [Solirubrobacterales bacterium]